MQVRRFRPICRRTVVRGFCTFRLRRRLCRCCRHRYRAYHHRNCKQQTRRCFPDVRFLNHEKKPSPFCRSLAQGNRIPGIRFCALLQNLTKLLLFPNCPLCCPACQEKFALLCSHPGEFVPGTAFFPKPPLIFVRRSPPTNCYSS